MIRSLIPLFALLVGVFWVCYWLRYQNDRENDRRRRQEQYAIDNYQLYQSPESVSEKWYDETAVGPCEVCGMDDAPLVVDHRDEHSLGYFVVLTKCKWCLERSSLSIHLEDHGVRRLRNGRAVVAVGDEK